MLLNHFTRAELLVAAEAADNFPAMSAANWAVNKAGKRCNIWLNIKSLRGEVFF